MPRLPGAVRKFLGCASPRLKCWVTSAPLPERPRLRWWKHWATRTPPCDSTPPLLWEKSEQSRSWPCRRWLADSTIRSEEHTSELQSRLHLVCRLLLEKKKYTTSTVPLQ